MPQILIAHNDRALRHTWAAQLDADGHGVYDANTTRNATDALQANDIDVLLLGALQRPAEAPALLTDLRAGRLGPAVDRALPVLTLGPVDQVATLRSYDAGSDHHADPCTDYLVLRAIIAALLRRATSSAAARPRTVQVGRVTIDEATREVRVGGELVVTTKREFALLRALAEDPTRVFTKHELLCKLWGGADAVGTPRTLDSHACRLRRKLAAHGEELVIAQWGVGYRLTDQP